MSNQSRTTPLKREDWAPGQNTGGQNTGGQGQGNQGQGNQDKGGGHSIGEMASQAGSMAAQAATDVGRMASQAVADVGRRADDLTASAGAGIRQVGDRIGRSAPQEGMLGTASQAVARTVRDSGEYLEEVRLSGLVKDIAHVVRQNPIPAVCVALGLGWLLARRLRN